ncbi:MAG TPA: hypothetical protein DC049_14410, partial [Spirochaetia bacterium]|nr:hypothetical protein [Spirochaetia bacterium]
MKKQFLFLLVCIIMLSCTAQKQKKKTIVKYMNPESSAAQIALMTKIARRFEKKYPDIHIELITGIKTEKIMAAIASGSGVDLFFNFMNIYSYIAAGSLVDLAPYISRYKMETTDFFSFAMKEVTHGQKIYGLPVQLGTSCLAYNKALLENENIPLPAPYMSKEDFFRYITTISSSQNRKDKAEKIFPLNSLNFIGYFESRILSLLNPDGSYNKKSRSVIVENMKTYQSIYKILPSQEELSSLSGGTTGATAHF